jgi:hypothetical protein
MKVVLDIQDSKADFILEWLKQYTYVKIKAEKKNKNGISKGMEPSIEAVKKIKEPKKRTLNPNKVQQLLLKGPVMTDSEYKDFLDKRKHFSSWK